MSYNLLYNPCRDVKDKIVIYDDSFELRATLHMVTNPVFYY